MKLSSYVISGKYIGATGNAGSTMIKSTIPFSSGCTSVGNTNSTAYSFSQVWQRPLFPKQVYQIMAYNPSTMPLSLDVYTEEVGLSTASALDYVRLTNFTVPASTETGLGRIITNVEGLFNYGNVKITLVNQTSGSSDSTSLSAMVAIKEWF